MIILEYRLVLHNYLWKYPTVLKKYYIAVYPPQSVGTWFEFYIFFKQMAYPRCEIMRYIVAFSNFK